MQTLNPNSNANRDAKSKIYTISQTARPTKEILRHLPIFWGGFLKDFQVFLGGVLC
jgi:hypothetical protein